MRVQFPSIPAKVLSVSLASSGSSFQLNDIKDWGGTNLAAAAFGDRAWAVFRNSDGTKYEVMRIDPSTIADSAITITKRGLSYGAPDYDTEVSANKLDWNANETIIELGSNPPQMYDELARKNDAESITAVYTFANTARPILDSDVDATDDKEFVGLGQLNRTALGTTLSNRLVVAGNAGETVAAGELCYLDDADSEWKLCDADTAATVDNVLLGVAQGAGTDGNAISGGLLLRGYDDNQTGLTANSVVYAGNTAGAIVSTTPGTTEVTVGVAFSTTEIYFSPRFNQMITEDQQDALGGTSGAPSATNKFVTNDDVTEAKTALRIPRRDANSDILVATTPTDTDAATSKAYVDSLKPLQARRNTQASISIAPAGVTYTIDDSLNAIPALGANDVMIITGEITTDSSSSTEVVTVTLDDGTTESTLFTVSQGGNYYDQNFEIRIVARNSTSAQYVQVTLVNSNDDTDLQTKTLTLDLTQTTTLRFKASNSAQGGLTGYSEYANVEILKG